MNERIKQIITVVLNNRVVSAETNLSATHRNIKTIEPLMYSYEKLYLQFKNKDYITHSINENTYHIEITRNKKS
jgi:hypothetical protein